MGLYHDLRVHILSSSGKNRRKGKGQDRRSVPGNKNLRLHPDQNGLYLFVQSSCSLIHFVNRLVKNKLLTKSQRWTRLDYRLVNLSSSLLEPIDAHCCHIGTAIKHPVPDRGKPVSFVIFDIRAL